MFGLGAVLLGRWPSDSRYPTPIEFTVRRHLSLAFFLRLPTTKAPSAAVSLVVVLVAASQVPSELNFVSQVRHLTPNHETDEISKGAPVSVFAQSLAHVCDVSTDNTNCPSLQCTTKLAGYVGDRA
jgi:hypothetical protein